MQKQITGWINPHEDIQTISGILKGNEWLDREGKRIRASGCEGHLIKKDGKLALMRMDFEPISQKLVGRLDSHIAKRVDIPEKELRELYCVQKLPIESIMKRFGVCRKSVDNYSPFVKNTPTFMLRRPHP